jgi:hypothetical protein
MSTIARGEGFPSTRPELITEEILIQPRVVRGLAEDIYTENAEHVDDMWLTPSVEVVVSDEGESKPVLLGRRYVSPDAYPREFPDRILYITDPERQTLQPWVIFPEFVSHPGVLDGEGNEITDPAQLRFIRDTLTTIDHALTERARAAASAPAFEARPAVLQAIDEQIGSLASRMAVLESLRQEVQDGKVLEMTVAIKNNWEREGGTSTEGKSYLDDANPTQLPDAIDDAITGFKDANNGRADVQGTMQVTLSAPGKDFGYRIPPEVWQTYFRQNQGSSSEKMAIGYAVEDASKRASDQS